MKFINNQRKKRIFSTNEKFVFVFFLNIGMPKKEEEVFKKETQTHRGKREGKKNRQSKNDVSLF
jgi:hypothetical protein